MTGSFLLSRFLGRGPAWRRGGVFALALAVPALPAAAVVGTSHEAAADIAPSLVMVLQHHGKAAGFCTGIVLGPRRVLTAAHCVPPGADLRIHYRTEAGEPVLAGVSSVRRHPGYRADAVARRERSIDLAVLTTTTTLPPRFRPAILAADAQRGLGTKLRIVGFGLTREGEAASSGQLREADLVLQPPPSTVLAWAADPTGDGTGACTGDSGGPLVDGTGAVMALTLWSAGAGSRRCGSLTQALWLAPYAAWIAAAP